jgi:rhodanese-related sulfurtransferase
MKTAHIQSKEFKDKMHKGDHILIDVRTPEEFNLGKLQNALLIDFYGDNFHDEIQKLDKNKKYLLYCRSGNRSGQAMMLMSQLGFDEVYNLENGIIGWMEEGHEIITD